MQPAATVLVRDEIPRIKGAVVLNVVPVDVMALNGHSRALQGLYIALHITELTEWVLDSRERRRLYPQERRKRRLTKIVELDGLKDLSHQQKKPSPRGALVPNVYPNRIVRFAQALRLT